MGISSYNKFVKLKDMLVQVTDHFFANMISPWWCPKPSHKAQCHPIHLHDTTNKSWAMCGKSAKAAKAVTFCERGDGPQDCCRVLWHCTQGVSESGYKSSVYNINIFPGSLFLTRKHLISSFLHTVNAPSWVWSVATNIGTPGAPWRCILSRFYLGLDFV